MPSKTSFSNALSRRIVPVKRPSPAVGSSASQGAELVGSVVVFLLIGLAIDAWLDTKPAFMIALTVFAMVGQFIKIYFTYSREMNRLEAERSHGAGGAGR